MVETPKIRKAKEKKEFLKRFDKALSSLPSSWIELFILMNPSYKGKSDHLSNVRRGFSIDLTVLELLEQMVVKITPPKK